MSSVISGLSIWFELEQPDPTGKTLMTARYAARSLQRYWGARFASGFATVELHLSQGHDHDHSAAALADVENRVNELLDNL